MVEKQLTRAERWIMKRKRVRSDIEKIQTETFGIPDWRHDEGYPGDWNSLTADEQRWEFLRRDSEYRAVWKMHTNDNLAARYDLKSFVDPKLSSKKFRENFQFIKSISSFKAGDIVRPDIFSPSGMKVSGELLDDNNLPLPLEVLKKDGQLKIQLQQRMAMRDAEAPNTIYDMRVWIEFDLRKAPTPQLKIAEAHLKNAIREARKVKMSTQQRKRPQLSGQYPMRLLQALDAKSCSHSYSKIAAHFEIEDTTVRDRFLDAMKYCQESRCHYPSSNRDD